MDDLGPEVTVETLTHERRPLAERSGARRTVVHLRST